MKPIPLLFYPLKTGNFLLDLTIPKKMHHLTHFPFSPRMHFPVNLFTPKPVVLLFQSVHRGVKAVKVFVAQILILNQIELASGIQETLSVSFPREIQPLRMPKFITWGRGQSGLILNSRNCQVNGLFVNFLLVKIRNMNKDIRDT